MTIVARRVASVPVRSSVETWNRMVELLTPPGSGARSELAGITSLAAMLISEEYTSHSPVTIEGSGALVLIYTLHGRDAIDHDLEDEESFAFDPTAGASWKLSLPACGADLELARDALKSAPHLDVREIGVDVHDGPPSAAPKATLTIDLDSLDRP